MWTTFISICDNFAILTSFSASLSPNIRPAFVGPFFWGWNSTVYGKTTGHFGQFCPHFSPNIISPGRPRRRCKCCRYRSDRPPPVVASSGPRPVCSGGAVVAFCLPHSDERSQMCHWVCRKSDSSEVMEPWVSVHICWPSDSVLFGSIKSCPPSTGQWDHLSLSGNFSGDSIHFFHWQLKDRKWPTK